MSTLCSQNQNTFDNLLVSIEARPDNFNLLLAVCNDKTIRDRTIAHYETKLDPDIRCYRVEIPRDEPSMRRAIGTRDIFWLLAVDAGSFAGITVCDRLVADAGTRNFD
jgi:hypothetical protein